MKRKTARPLSSSENPGSRGAVYITFARILVIDHDRFACGLLGQSIVQSYIQRSFVDMNVDDRIEAPGHYAPGLQNWHPARTRLEESTVAGRDPLQVQLPGYRHYPAADARHSGEAVQPLHYALTLTCAATALKTSEMQALRWDEVLWASLTAEGKVPLNACSFVKDHLRVAAKASGVPIEDGQLFGLHNLRHSLSNWLVNKGKVEPKTVQGLLRHSKIQTTLDLYTQEDSDETRAAQGAFLSAVGLQERTIQ